MTEQIASTEPAASGFFVARALAAAHESCAGRLGGMDLDEFKAELADFAVHPVTVAGEVAGALLVRGPDIHVCVLPWAHARWLTKAVLRVLDQVIATCGHAQTSATTEAGRVFIQRLGFEAGSDGIYRSNKRWVSKH